MRPDEDISRRYRDLAREEPGAALDGAILAASRRAVQRPAARRWAVPVSIAAVLVLSFGLTMEMRNAEPDIATSIPERSATPPPPAAAESQNVAPAAKDLAAPAPSMEYAVRPKTAAPPPKPAARAREPERAIEQTLRAQKPASEAETRGAEAQDRLVPREEKPVQKDVAPDVALPQRATAPVAPAAPASHASRMNAAPAVAPPASGADTTAVTTTPVPAESRAKAASGALLREAPMKEETTPQARELERIAQLRTEGRDAEADKALDEFRRIHPGYRIPDAMWERVRPR